jgi:hypothetical protein
MGMMESHRLLKCHYLSYVETFMSDLIDREDSMAGEA